MKTIFDQNFYPTPPEIAARMIAKFQKKPSFVLDPSAGKGDLLDAAKKKWFDFRYGEDNLCAIEKDPNLRHILSGKGYKVIDSDFLTYTGCMKFSHIILNPPFDQGARHLLQAWNILYNGEIVCLLNQETYDNPHTKERRLLRDIIAKNGEVERLGACFDTAERKTGVNVVMVYLRKENAIEKDYFEGLKQGGNRKHTARAVNEFQLAERNNIENMVKQYDKAIDSATRGFIKLQEASWYAGNITDEYGNPMAGHKESGLLSGLFYSSDYTSNLNNTLNSYIASLKVGAWQNILKITQFQEVMTNNIRRNFESRIKTLSEMEFTVENIESLLYELRMNSDNIMKQAVLDAFDLITAYHKENRVYFEGWKTNKSWKIGKRFILPQVVTYSSYSMNPYSFRHWGRREFEIADIEKVLLMLKGCKETSICVRDIIALNKGEKSGISDFFKLKWYKKGTMHFEFRDLKLLERFNYLACLGKNWLPPADCEEPEAERIMIEYKKAQ